MTVLIYIIVLNYFILTQSFSLTHLKFIFKPETPMYINIKNFKIHIVAYKWVVLEKIKTFS